jgi:hypothetical protein
MRAINSPRVPRARWRCDNPLHEGGCKNRVFGGATLIPEMRKPFDVLAEGLVSEKSRGDRTAIELFTAGVRAMPAELARAVEARATTSV